jgi:hypothetical protein
MTWDGRERDLRRSGVRELGRSGVREPVGHRHRRGGPLGAAIGDAWGGRECVTGDGRECVTGDGRECVTRDGREEGENLPASRRAREPMKSSGGDRVSGR